MNRARGFTLLELLVVIVMLCLLAGMLIPALAKGRVADQAIICMNNHKELQLACQLYSQSYNGQICNNFTIPETYSSINSKKLDNWVNNIMTWTITGVDGQSGTNINLVKNGILAQFSSDPVEMYKCPADNYLSLNQKKAGWTRRLRSSAMNALFGRSDTSPASATGRSWADGGAWRQFLRSSDVPNPARTWMTIDEQADSVNDGFFIAPGPSSWGDIPGAYHGGGCTFSFADAHVESHKWKSARSKISVRFGSASFPPAFDAAGKQDFQWYKERTGYIRFQ
jgi:prepilin-type N-terminal cleavage/methylation domain-containing protein/prepilin-type processing-associated H-X9-DG protein